MDEMSTTAELKDADVDYLSIASEKSFEKESTDDDIIKTMQDLLDKLTNDENEQLSFNSSESENIFNNEETQSSNGTFYIPDEAEIVEYSTSILQPTTDIFDLYSIENHEINITSTDLSSADVGLGEPYMHCLVICGL
jgi:hypothetical protein